jgi:hypothetical protein
MIPDIKDTGYKDTGHKDNRPQMASAILSVENFTEVMYA